jgi:hypothetical protein
MDATAHHDSPAKPEPTADEKRLTFWALMIVFLLERARPDHRVDGDAEDH